MTVKLYPLFETLPLLVLVEAWVMVDVFCIWVVVVVFCIAFRPLVWAVRHGGRVGSTGTCASTIAACPPLANPVNRQPQPPCRFADRIRAVRGPAKRSDRPAHFGGVPQLRAFDGNRNIGDFRVWKDRDAYKRTFERLLRDLRVEAPDASASSAGRCSRNIEMTPLCKIEVTLPLVLGSREMRHGGGVDEQAGVRSARGAAGGAIRPAACCRCVRSDRLAATSGVSTAARHQTERCCEFAVDAPRQTQQPSAAGGGSVRWLCRSCAIGIPTLARPWRRRSWRRSTAARSRGRRCAVG